MQEFVHTQGIIIRTEPIGEYDRRIVILTRDKGKITAFARGARRQTNKLMACTDYFCFGEFKLFPGKNSYSLSDATIQNYFQELRDDFNGMLYGMYFLEVMDYHTKENNDEKEMLKLLYQTLRATIHPAYDNSLVKIIFELKTMVLMGEYKPCIDSKYKESTLYAQDFIIHSKPEKLYSFDLKEEIRKELKEIVDKAKKELWYGHEFKSEEMLRMLEM